MECKNNESISQGTRCTSRIFFGGLLLLFLNHHAIAIDDIQASNPMRDVVVVAPKSWQATLTNWQDFRRSQGYRIQLVAPGSTADATRDAIKAIAMQTGNQVDFIVLAADAPDFRATSSDTSQQDTVPTFYIDSKVVVRFGSTATIATDHPYANWRQDDNYSSVVGRVPAKTAKDLGDYFDRVIQYETAKSQDRSLKKIDIIAGVGGFGAVTDTVVESITRQLLSEDIPSEYQLNMMQASPTSVYYPNPLLFSQTALDRLNQGSLLWIYLGHGFVNTLDMIPHEDRLLPILTHEQLPRIKISGLPPIAIFLACYLGAFDATGGCLAEQMVMLPGGPIAAIAGSRVTMPYGMGILGGGMLEAAFRDQRLTIGEILTRAKQSSLIDTGDVQKSTQIHTMEAKKDSVNVPSRREFLDTLAGSLSPEDHDIALERQEHTYLFNLLGDPLIRLSRPLSIDINTPQSIRRGEPLVINGTTPIEGRCEIEIVYPRKRIPDDAKKIRTELQKATSNKLEIQQKLFESANRSAIQSKLIPSVKDNFYSEFSTTDVPLGKFEICVAVYGENQWAVKSVPIEFKK